MWFLLFHGAIIGGIIFLIVIIVGVFNSIKGNGNDSKQSLPNGTIEFQERKKQREEVQLSNQKNDSQVKYKTTKSQAKETDENSIKEQYYGRVNDLVDGKTYLLIKTNEMGMWENELHPMVKTLDEKMCNEPYIANCMLEQTNIYLNEDMDEKFWCMHTPKTAREAGIDARSLGDAKSKNKKYYPKFTVVKTLPIAINLQELLSNASEDRIELYQHILGVNLDELTCEYIPQYQRALAISKPYRSKKSMIVKL